MTPLEDLVEKISTARAIGEPFGMVVLTASEAQAIVDQVQTLDIPLEFFPQAEVKSALPAPPHEGDDEHA